MFGKKEKQNKNNMQLKFYTWLGIEPRTAQALRSSLVPPPIGPQRVELRVTLIQSYKNYNEE